MIIIDKIKKAIQKRNEEEEKINAMIEASQLFNCDKDIVIKEDLEEGKLNDIKTLCAYLSSEKTKKIVSILNNFEEVYCVVEGIQRKTYEELFFIYSNQRLIIMNNKTNKYLEAPVDYITKLEVIKSALMTQFSNVNDVIMDINLNKADFEIFKKIVTDPNEREKYVQEVTKYLCGITPVYQKMNALNTGISIDQNNVVIFHDQKINNHVIKYSDIQEYEIIEDNTLILSGKNYDPKKGISSSKSDCFWMNLRITLNDGKVIDIPIIFPNSMKKAYSHYDERYKKCYTFAKEIIDKLNTLS